MVQCHENHLRNVKIVIKLFFESYHRIRQNAINGKKLKKVVVILHRDMEEITVEMLTQYDNKKARKVKQVKIMTEYMEKVNNMTVLCSML